MAILPAARCAGARGITKGHMNNSSINTRDPSLQHPARYYRNKAVTEYRETSKIAVHFLPPYSPNLNPIERLWKWMKERVIYNLDFATFCVRRPRDICSWTFDHRSNVQEQIDEESGPKKLQSRDNTYYLEFEDFKAAVFGFFAVLSGVDLGSVLGRLFRSRVRDQFRPISIPLTAF